METQIQRQGRIDVEIPITITSVFASIDAAIVDLTEHGAQVTGYSLPTGTRFQIEYLGQTIYAQCRWAEIDRMGVKFFFPLTDGPLFERLTIARASQFPGEVQTGTAMAYAPMHGRQGSSFGGGFGGSRTFGRAPQAGFGRRFG